VKIRVSRIGDAYIAEMKSGNWIVNHTAGSEAEALLGLTEKVNKVLEKAANEIKSEPGRRQAYS